MYLQRFGLKMLPFRLSPDVAFLFPSANHLAATESLRRVAAGRGGITVLTGPAGAGKTTLIERLLLDVPTTTAVARLHHGLPSTIALLQGLLVQFGYAPYHLTRAELASALHTFVAEREHAQQHTLVVIDEAQRLSNAGLAELLGDLTPEMTRLAVLLVGDPSLHERIRDAEIVPSHAPRVGHIELSPLRPDELVGYLEHRLLTAGATDRQIFEDTAVDLLMRVTGGLPKFINKLADGALAAAFDQNRNTVQTEDVLSAARLLGEIETSQRRYGGWTPAAVAQPAASSNEAAPDTAGQAAAEPLAELSQTTDAATAIAPRWRLRLQSKGAALRTMTISTGDFYIGRSRENDLQIESRYISRRHCRLTVQPDRLTIEDLDSTNGLKLRGEPIWKDALQDGDVVHIGIHELHFETVDPER